MRVFIEHRMDESGKAKFLKRATREWDKMGVGWSTDPSGCDIRLAMTRFRSKSKLPTVIRIDGAHQPLVSGSDYKSKRVKDSIAWKNKQTAKSIKKSSAVIYQSDFCKRMGNRVFGVKHNNEHVIFNGAHSNEFKLPEIVSKEYKNIILSAKWKGRPHKRLREMVEIANKYCETREDVKFRIAGDMDIKLETHERVAVLGDLDSDKLNGFICTSDCMLNLAYYDWCPNAVVECLVAGKPVICSNGTGVAEIVKDSGVVLNLDTHDLKTLKRAAKPPRIDYQPVYDALDNVLFGGASFPFPDHLHIETVAKQYMEVFENVLRKS